MVWHLPRLGKQQKARLQVAQEHLESVHRQTKDVNRAVAVARYIKKENHVGPQIINAVSAPRKKGHHAHHHQ